MKHLPFFFSWEEYHFLHWKKMTSLLEIAKLSPLVLNSLSLCVVLFLLLFYVNAARSALCAVDWSFFLNCSQIFLSSLSSSSSKLQFWTREGSPDFDALSRKSRFVLYLFDFFSLFFGINRCMLFEKWNQIVDYVKLESSFFLYSFWNVYEKHLARSHEKIRFFVQNQPGPVFLKLFLYKKTFLVNWEPEKRRFKFFWAS